jgi:hypothetical protein
MNTKTETTTIPAGDLGCLADTEIKEIVLVGQRAPSSSGLWGIPFVALLALGLLGGYWFRPWAFALGATLAAALVGLRSMWLREELSLYPVNAFGQSRDDTVWIRLCAFGVVLTAISALTRENTAAGMNTGALLALGATAAACASFLRSSSIGIPEMSVGAVAVSGYATGELILFSGQKAPRLLMPWNRASRLFGRRITSVSRATSDVVVGIIGATDNRHRQEGLYLGQVMDRLESMADQCATSLDNYRHFTEGTARDAQAWIERKYVEMGEEFTKNTGLQANLILIRTSDIAPEGLRGIDPCFGNAKGVTEAKPA